MKKSALVTLAALLLLAWGLALRSQYSHEFTTSSPEAFDLYVLGNEQLNAFQWPEARESLNKALELDPGFAMAQAAFAIAIRAITEAEVAKAALARADSLAILVEDDDERMLVQLRLAAYHLSFESMRDSLVAQLNESRPDHPIVLSARALIAMEEQKGDEAAAIWLQLLEIDPNYARAYNWLGYNAAYMGRYDEAETYLRKYAYLAPDLANPHDSLGEILSYTGQYKEAAQQFKAALEKQPDFFISIINLAQVYIEQGKLKKGSELLNRLRDKTTGTPYEMEVDRRLISIYWDHRLLPQLEQATHDYFTNHPDGKASALYRAFYLAGQGKTAEGQALCDSFIAARREEPYFQSSYTGRETLARIEYTTVATLAEVTEDATTATQNWEMALQNSSTLAPHALNGMRIRYGMALARLGRHEEALKQAEQILAVNPRLLQPLLLRAQTTLALGQWKKAEKAYAALIDALVEADVDHPIVLKAAELADELHSQIGS